MTPRADLVVGNARLWSSGGPIGGADTLAVSGGRVQAVGPRSRLEALVGADTLELDARGATVTPGLADAHVHLTHWARALHELDLSGASSRAEALERVRLRIQQSGGEAAAAPLVGRGWDANAWAEAPDRASLDLATGKRPVLLHSRDFHTVWANSAALERAGIARDTADPPGGRIERDAAGEPTGILREHASRLCASLEAEAAGSDLERLRGAVRRLHAFGVTSVHDFEGAEAQRALRALTRGPEPLLRVLMHLPHAGLEHARSLGLESGTGDDTFRLGAVKLFADGTLGSRTAALLEPYDGTADRGMELISPEELRATVSLAVKAGLSVAVHAIGDRAVRSALDALEAVRGRIASLALPPRLEHVQLAAQDDLPRFAALGVAASMQPFHCVSDMELARRHWGTRTGRAYAWRSLLDRGALLAFGSDAPVESPNPAEGLAAAVTRERPSRPGDAFVPEQRLSLDQALAAYTEGPARLAGWWPSVGSLAAGAAADFVVWNADLHRLPPAELGQAHPLYTVLCGRVVHERGARDRSAERAGSAERRAGALQGRAAAALVSGRGSR